MSSKPVPGGTIVAGVDGSPTGDLALGWAVEEATRKALPLHIIHAFSYGYPMTDIGIGHAINGLRELADGVRRDAVTRAHRANPDLVITWSQPASRAAPSLVEASEQADTVVIGARGLSAAGGIFMGSVSVQVAAHARCPVVIVHETPTPEAGSPVVVGVDGSEVSSSAIAYAYEQASLRGVGLTVVHVWWLDHVEDAGVSAIWTVDWQTFAEDFCFSI